jgi:hemoglobin
MMRQVFTAKLLISVFLAGSVLTGAVRAQDMKPTEKSLDLTRAEETIYKNLRGVIDHGANLYNQGDWNGCYRLWEGALMTLKPLLDHRSKLQAAIDTGIGEARKDPSLWHRAWVLRPVLDKIRADIRADHPQLAKREAASARIVAPKSSPKTLWDRLGGERGVTNIVDDFVELTALDPKVDFFRGGKYKPTNTEVAKMKRELVEQISEASGGPLKYKGPDMKAVHKDMGITDSQFHAAAANLKKALEKNKVAAEDVEKVISAVGRYRKEIVEPKEKEEKKPAEKKEEKKPAGAASVQGHITFQGKPLTGGTIVLMSAQGNSGGDIKADGTYRVEGVKPGEYTVSVKGGKGDAVPAKYGDPKTSGLMINVTAGTQSFDIDLR